MLSHTISWIMTTPAHVLVGKIVETLGFVCFLYPSPCSYERNPQKVHSLKRAFATLHAPRPATSMYIV